MHARSRQFPSPTRRSRRFLPIAAAGVFAASPVAAVGSSSRDPSPRGRGPPHDAPKLDASGAAPTVDAAAPLHASAGRPRSRPLKYPPHKDNGVCSSQCAQDQRFVREPLDASSSSCKCSHRCLVEPRSETLDHEHSCISHIGRIGASSCDMFASKLACSPRVDILYSLWPSLPQAPFQIFPQGSSRYLETSYEPVHLVCFLSHG